MLISSEDILKSVLRFGIAPSMCRKIQNFLTNKMQLNLTI